MSTLIHRRVDDCQAGRNPKTVCRVHSGWVVLGDVQFVRGYSLLLPDPVVTDLNHLEALDRKTFLYEMSVVGDVLLELTDATRVNYEILGNSEHALHAHIFPRYAYESEALRSRPVWFYDWENAPTFSVERDKPLIEAMRQSLRSIRAVA